MPVIITSDLHFSDNPRDDYRHVFVDFLVDQLKRKKASRLLILGDLTEEKDRHSAWLVNTVADHMVRLSDECPVIILRGNHDALDPSTPFYEFLDYIEDIEWINTPTVVDVDDLGKCLFLPHTSNYKKDWKDLDFKSPDLIFAHNTFSGTRSESGMELEGVPPSVFPRGSRVYSGDIHSPQKVGCVQYVGAPYTIDFGDAYEGRILCLFPKSGGYQERTIPYHGPQKKLVEVTTSDDGEIDFSKIPSMYEGEILKVRVTLRPDEYDRWSEVRDSVKVWGQKNKYTVNVVQPIKETVDRKPSELINRSNKSDGEILEEYASSHGVPSRVLKIGLGLLDR